jgi:peptidyl-prolyl cis-trans isomerase A (cyclophilin A)
MKSRTAAILCAALAMSFAVASFAQAATSGNSSSKRSSAMSSDPALMNPAALNAQAPATYDVKVVTTQGDFTVHVTRAWSPLGADRFYNLVKHGFYDGQILFRVVPGFVVQFGISADPRISAVWQNANIKDDPKKHSNTKGTITFATSGPNSRTTQVFINLGNNGNLDNMGFTPFGEVSGMDVVEHFYGGYADQPTGHQGEISSQGNAYLEKNFPKLDKIKSATIVSK